jgi:hypothetical protein
MRLWVLLRELPFPFEVPFARLCGVALSPEKAGDVLAAVDWFLEPLVAGESTSSRFGAFRPVAKWTHLF